MKTTPIHQPQVRGATLVLAASILLGGVTSCDRPLKSAFGDRNEIVVFADEPTWDRYGGLLTSIFEREIRTPRSEYIFQVRHEVLDKWPFFSRYYHLALCAAIDENSPTAAMVRDLLSDEVEERIRSEGRGRAIISRDPYAAGQILMIITADTADRLQAYLRVAREHIFGLMEDHLNELISALIYREDEQYDIEETLLEEYGFTVRVPWGFRMNTDHEDENFIRMIKYQLERWFFAWWLPGEEIDGEGVAWVRALEELGARVERNEAIETATLDFLGQQAMDLRDRISRRFYDRDAVNREETTATLVEFEGRWAVRLSGLWGNAEKLAGGPIVSYCFYDPATARLWWLDGAVFAPNEPKETQIRQMDVMMHTFRTGEEAIARVDSIRGLADERR